MQRIINYLRHSVNLRAFEKFKFNCPSNVNFLLMAPKNKGSSVGKNPTKSSKKPLLFLKDTDGSELPWFELLSPLLGESLSQSLSSTPVSFTPGQLELLRTKGKQLIETQEAIFLENAPNDLSFYLNLLNEGTRSDRLAAYGLLVAKAPHFFISKLSEWMVWISSGINRAESIGDAIVSLAQVFSSHIIPTTHKLKYMEQRQGPKIPSDPELWVWAVEDSLKRAYADLIRLFEKQLMSPYEQLRLRLLPVISNLFSTHPEQESALLSLLFAKLGDSSKKVASTSGRLILKIINMHPAMTEVVVSGLWQQVLISKLSSSASPNSSKASTPSTSSLHAQYYGIVLLTQIPLDSRFQDLARKMIAMYVSLIEELLSDRPEAPSKDKKKNVKKEENQVDSHKEKLLSFILKGVHNAFSICKDAKLPSIDILFRLTHIGSWSKSLQAFWLLYKISKEVPSLQERFQKSLWESLVDDRSAGHGRYQAEQHIAIVKTFLMDKMSGDFSAETLPIILAFVKRWLAFISLSGSIAFMCAVLQAILEVFLLITRKRPSIIKDIILPPGDYNNSWDPLKRDPSWCGVTLDASKKKLVCSFFEICPFLLHYHPSVSTLAKAILASTRGVSASTKGISAKELDNPETILKNSTSNPFESYSLSSFLDRWAYKNPKKHSKSEAPIPSTSDFSSLSSHDVCASDVFYHKYFVNKAKRVTTNLSIPDGSDGESDFDGIDLVPSDGSQTSDVDIQEPFSDDDGDDIDGLSEEDGLVSSDEDIGYENGQFLDADAEEEGANDQTTSKDNRTPKRKRVKLPLLASAEEYEKYLI